LRGGSRLHSGKFPSTFPFCGRGFDSEAFGLALRQRELKRVRLPCKVGLNHAGKFGPLRRFHDGQFVGVALGHLLVDVASRVLLVVDVAGSVGDAAVLETMQRKALVLGDDGSALCRFAVDISLGARRASLTRQGRGRQSPRCGRGRLQGRGSFEEDIVGCICVRGCSNCAARRRSKFGRGMAHQSAGRVQRSIDPCFQSRFRHRNRIESLHCLASTVAA